MIIGWGDMVVGVIEAGVVEDADCDEDEDMDKDEEFEVVEGEVVDEVLNISSANGGLVSWGLHREFCSTNCKASVATEASDPPCALSVSSLNMVW